MIEQTGTGIYVNSSVRDCNYNPVSKICKCKELKGRTSLFNMALSLGDRGVRRIFFRGGKVTFSDFFVT